MRVRRSMPICRRSARFVAQYVQTLIKKPPSVTIQSNAVSFFCSIALDLLNVVMVYLLASMILLYAQHAFYLINSFLMILLTGFAVDSLRKSLF